MRSAIVSHLTPTPHEICPVCKEIVQDAEIFACSCGGDSKSLFKHNPSPFALTHLVENEFPTIRCLTCSEWYHRPCVNISENEDQKFVCQRCTVQTSPSSPGSTGHHLLGPGSPNVNNMLQLDHQGSSEDANVRGSVARPRIKSHPTQSEHQLYTHRQQSQLFRDAIQLPMANAGPFLPQQMYKPHTTSDIWKKSCSSHLCISSPSTLNNMAFFSRMHYTQGPSALPTMSKLSSKAVDPAFPSASSGLAIGSGAGRFPPRISAALLSPSPSKN